MIDGGFSHGRGFWGRTDLEYGPRLNNTRLRLWCLPFGRRAVVALSSDTLENHQGGANLNYADITGIEGDVDAPCQMKLVPSGASGTAKVWIATRTGTRRTDTLWRQGESRDSFARQYTPRAPEQLVDSTQTIAGTSDGDAQRTRLGRADSRPVTLNRRIYGRWRFAMSGPPKGLFRILCRVKATIVRPNSAAWSNMSFYAGWDAGGLSSTPRLGIDTKKPVADDTWTTIDFGELRIPATTDPDGQTLDTFNVDIFTAYETRGHVTLHYGRADWSIDYLMLLPVDEGIAILDRVTSTDRILLDSESKPSTGLRHGQLRQDTEGRELRRTSADAQRAGHEAVRPPRRRTSRVLRVVRRLHAPILGPRITPSLAWLRYSQPFGLSGGAPTP